MSGALVPYHQRQNKAVDRQLFIDLLTRVNRYLPIADYNYYSFGGAFLEDFKLIHSHFGNEKLFSIENDATAFARQKFNLPLSCITCMKKDSSVFVDEFTSHNNSIIWLDFAEASGTREQLQELQALLPKLLVGDVVKITLNANPGVLHGSKETKPDGKRETTEEINKLRLDKLKERIGDFLPQGVSEGDMTIAGLPNVLCSALEFAANKAMESRIAERLYFQPLASFAYSDSEHQMLTVTGIILHKAEKGPFFAKTQLKRWKPSTTTWGTCKQIMVPALTAKEKIFIDQQLPKKSGKQIQKSLKFLLDKNALKSLQIIENYRMYYRYYPNFHKVVL